MTIACHEVLNGNVPVAGECIAAVSVFGVSFFRSHETTEKSARSASVNETNLPSAHRDGHGAFAVLHAWRS